ncbi:T-kininogen 1-like [Pelodytes ibericus]
MRLLSTLLLCTHLLIVFANQVQIDADCNAFDIFDAVDVALIRYNAEKENGNQFVLHKITDAKIQHENESLIHKFVSYDVREGSCAVKSGKVWQQCEFKTPDMGLGHCSAHVLINTEFQSSHVVSQNCTLPVVEPVIAVHNAMCLGCFHTIDINNDEVLNLVQSAIEKLNTVGNHPFLFDLENIQSATRQVVSGWNYKIIFDVRQTNCSKSTFPTLISGVCTDDENGEQGHCSTYVFVTHNEEIKDLSVECIANTGFCLSCANEVEPRDPVLRNLLKGVIDEYNLKSNHTNLFKDLEVESAKKEELQGKVYNVYFTIQETNCSKANYSALEEECHSEPSSTMFSCYAIINTTEKNVRSTNDCKSTTIRTSLKGLSPLRGIIRFPRAIEGSRGQGGPKHSENKEKKHGKKEKKAKKDKRKKKNKNKNKNGESSEESEEYDYSDTTVAPLVTGKPYVPVKTTQVIDVLLTTQHLQTTDREGQNTQVAQDPIKSTPYSLLPSLPVDEGTFPNLHENTFLELPEPDVPPRCPSAPWIPKGLISVFPPFKPPLSTSDDTVTPGQPFTDEDLLDGLDF